VTVAVKDLIDMVGVPTTAGCKAVADHALPAERDAACLAEIRVAEALGTVRIVGKTNLHELAYGITGINPWFGTPVNPLDPRLVPGGSSSGSAVAVATGEADLALGSDTGGSIRIPAACCGVVGLKTTWRRVPLDGVWPLAPSFDTVGPMARDVAGLVVGMELLEPGFAPAGAVDTTVGRLRLPARPEIDAAIDRALRAAELDVVDIDLPDWHAVLDAALTILDAEAWAVDGPLLAAHPEGISPDVADRLLADATVMPADVAAAREVQARWQSTLAALQAEAGVAFFALPTLADFPPPLDHPERMRSIRYTLAVNLAGVPALALPVPTGGPLPASLQLVGPAGSEEELIAYGHLIEAAS